MEDNEIFTNCQIDFVGSNVNVQAWFDRIQARDGWADYIYLDLRKKTFDKVPHKKHLRKLEKDGGVNGKLLAWTERGKKKIQTIRKQPSVWSPVSSGVPHGSSPLSEIFGVYINYMVNNVLSCVTLCDDNATLLRFMKETENCEELQSDLDKMWVVQMMAN